MFYPDLDGNGRADMHSVIGTFDNRAETWFNPSCGLSDHQGDDSDGLNEPQLPTPPEDPSSGAPGASPTSIPEISPTRALESTSAIYYGQPVWEIHTIWADTPAVSAPISVRSTSNMMDN